MIEKFSLRFVNTKTGSDEFVARAFLRHTLDPTKNYKMTLNLVEAVISDELIGSRIFNLFSNIPI